METKKQQIVQLSKRIEAALGILNRRIDGLEFLLENGRVARRDRALYKAERDVLESVMAALREERSNPRTRVVRALGHSALVALALAGAVATGALEEVGSMGAAAAVDAVRSMVSAADDVDETDLPDPVEYDEAEVEAAIEEVRRFYRPASRDDIPWDDEDGRWVAPVVDVWDAVSDSLDDRAESLQRVVIGVLLAEEGGDWIAESWIDSMGE